ncbi:Arylsulfatase [Pontiella desulfatans]|uniref:Arylsulfatase n=2 Tax=Pontiella desulfatans TaxID=2750659 RepID=A0A6C2TX68_PONDE|nr:sulfatase S1_72 [Kiritimatiellales bacterium]VGO11911.1 Arylsulfatase [Pontiella desulfatans]
MKHSFYLTLLIAGSAFAKTQPNVLWVLTDDHRYDSIRAFNQMMTGDEMSPLGYVESPSTDKLAEMGTTFINTYCHAQGCAPSRASMHLGRYPFRSGIYEFEWFNKDTEHWKPSLPEQMAALGYQTFHVGKLGVRVRTTNRNGKFGTHQIYQQDISFHRMFDEGLTGWSKGEVTEVAGIKLDKPTHCDWLRTLEGTWEYTGYELNKIAGLENHSKQVDEKYDILRKYASPEEKQPGYGEIIGGVSSQPAGKNRDGRYTTELVRFLENPSQTLAVGSQTFTGVNPSKPLFANIGYDFPHTPVLPPKSFRDRFLKKKYTIPVVDKDEFGKLPPQLQGLIKKAASEHYSDADKQQMVQDYYAYCAYGDHLIGEAVEAFLAYSKKQKQPWMIVYVCGDHGWRLNEHGSIYKFAPWKTDALDPIIVVSSDKKRFPAGKVVTDLTEFVDIAPTIMAAGGANLEQPQYAYLDGYDLAKVTSGELEPRDYIVGESHAVTGPRATLRTPDYMFSIKSRPKNKMGGKDMKWAMTASYKDLEPVLYDMKRDPDELNNLAFNPEYKGIAMKMKDKLLNIVIGDNRVEVIWNAKGDGTEVSRSNFAPGADDKKLKL